MEDRNELEFRAWLFRMYLERNERCICRECDVVAGWMEGDDLDYTINGVVENHTGVQLHLMPDDTCRQCNIYINGLWRKECDKKNTQSK